MPTDLRAGVASELETLSAVGAPLHTKADVATWRVHSVAGADPYSARYTPARVRLHEELIQEFLGASEEVATEGRAAVITAGPPATGKSTRLNQLGYGRGWRRIDADVFKTMLIRRDLDRGALLLPAGESGRVLADGREIMPMELAGLYHLESVVVADKARKVCMEQQQNIIVEGTLSWPALVDEITEGLAYYYYQRLDVLLVEVPLETALEQALQRWWAGRLVGGLGGRFTPAESIRSLYASSTVSVCGDNARRLVASAEAAGIRSTLVQ